jgi:hypothetical protein
MPDRPHVEPRRGREGARWINVRPTPEEFAEWAKTSIKIDPALDLADYIGGLVLIPAVDNKAKTVTGFNATTGEPTIVERPELAFIPYAKVETRINYFWNYLAAHEELVGVVESKSPPRMPIDFGEVVEAVETADGTVTTKTAPARPSAMTALIHQLPEGFHVLSVPLKDGYVHFLCCTKRVAIYRRADLEALPDRPSVAIHPVREGVGTKMIPLVKNADKSWAGADQDSIMKAETGALGRALGFAGIFVIPGSGIATAEDMVDSMTATPTAVQAVDGGQGPAEPEAVQRPVTIEDSGVKTGAEARADGEADLKREATSLWKLLSASYPEKAAEFGAWAKARKPPVTSLSDLSDAALRGTLKTLERLCEEGRVAEVAANQAKDPAHGLAGPVPTETPNATS